MFDKLKMVNQDTDENFPRIINEWIESSLTGSSFKWRQDKLYKLFWLKTFAVN